MYAGQFVGLRRGVGPGRPTRGFAATAALAVCGGEVGRRDCTASRSPTTYGLETVRVRFFNIFGPRQRADSPYSGVIALFIAAMSAGKTPTVHGDGLQSRDFTYVDKRRAGADEGGRDAGRVRQRLQRRHRGERSRCSTWSQL